MLFFCLNVFFLPVCKQETIDKDIKRELAMQAKLQIALVAIGTDYSRKSTADSILAHYPQALAQVQDISVTLIGQVESRQL